ncbi:MAG: L,D-transpeptidase family protein [Alistipes sp.]|nr:L,D-transpeptidase family protein [Alistipes sp.]
MHHRLWRHGKARHKARGRWQEPRGCVAMAEEDVKRLVEWLDPKQNPHIVILGKEWKPNITK